MAYKFWRDLRIILSTLSMYLVSHLLVFLALPILLVLVILDPRWIARIKKAAAPVLLGIVGKKLTVTGSENVPPGRGTLIVANYPSFYAGFVLMSLFPHAWVIAHAFIARIPLMGSVLKRMRAAFVDPHKPRTTLQSLAGLAGEDRQNDSVLLFPEGGRTPDGGIQPFKRGLAYLVRHSGRDVLPITLNGFYTLKPMKRFYLDPDARLEVVVHPPLRNADLRDLGDEELLTRVTAAIRSVYAP